MTNKEIVENNLELVRTCVECQFSGKKDKKYKDDVFQDVCVYLLDYNNDKLNDACANNHLNALITKVIRNQIFSRSSKFWRQYERWEQRTEDISEVIDKENAD
jgi:hypothetical protein